MSLEQKIPDNIIVIPHTHPLRWIMMFYALPKEMFEKLPKYRQLPRNMRPIQVSEKYMRMINCDDFLIMIWSLYAWTVWHCLRVPGKNDEYRPIPGAWQHYSEDFPIWRITYEIGMHFREIFEHCSNWKMQRLFDLKKDEEMPWLTLPQFCAIVKSMAQFVIDGMNLQPFIDEVWYHRAEEDYAGENYAYRDFMRSWTHSRTATSVSIDEIIESGVQVDGQVIFDLPDPRAAFEEHVVSTVKVDQFKERLTEKDRIILQMRHDDYTLQEIADAVGYKTASTVKKRIDKIAAEYNDFVSAEYSDFLTTTSSNNIIRISAVTLAVASFCMRERRSMSYQIFDDLPDILDASQIASALRISRAGAYNLLSSEDFPTLHIGRRKLVMKNDLITWLKSHTNTTQKH